MPINLVRFPLNTKVKGWTSTPRFSTDITVGKSGHESRNANWQDALLRFNASYAVRTKQDASDLKDFFMYCRGRETSFLIKDWQDFKIVSQGLHGEIPADGVRTTWQIFRTYTSVLNYVRRDITKPVSGTLSVVLVPAQPSITWTISLTTGIMTASAAPSSGSQVIVSCEFDVPARFDVDELPIEFFRYWTLSGVDQAQVMIPDIPMVEVRGE